ncbi:hypothetical protein HMPREF0183_1908 [Brevibacterium mcbrellneri ATCC 49030]|uniref:Uncharacterized protein n=1 Tax=Brevibacterium mcbrellneri ATCC 49030 TaxID=585530 RepID=D4YPP8_9MICO|nr:hypothetical protein HMPREF0183_1908 [Brevibacterium mcbrellneri ATCC 49030]
MLSAKASLRSSERNPLPVLARHRWTGLDQLTELLVDLDDLYNKC